jgi:hypothetical protein
LRKEKKQAKTTFLWEFELKKKLKGVVYVVSLVTRETLHFEELKKIIFSTQVNRISSLM